MVKDYFKNYYILYSIPGICAAAAVLCKVFLFYYFIGTITNIALVCAVSCLLIYLLFASVKNKWVPAAVFAVISALMFCDVMYSSFFNSYLSVNLIASAEVLGDITASILEVFRLQFLLLFADVALIFTCLILRRAHRKPEKKNSIFFHIKWAAAVLMIGMLIANVSGSILIKSVSNQEIITYHIKDIVYKAFAITGEEAGLSAFKDTYKYEKIGPYFGIAKGRNLIVIQLESFQNFVVGLEYNGQEITPNLNRLIEGNTAYFDRYYQQIGSGNTSDAEFASNNSIYGSLMSYTYKIYGRQNYFRGLPVLLKEKGYETAVFHAYENKDFWSRKTAYPGMGFEKYFGGLNDRPGDGVYEMKEWMGWGLTDTYFYEQTLTLMDELTPPFYSFVVSLSNHHPYLMLTPSGERPRAAEDSYSFIELFPEDEDTIVGNYLQSASYSDNALGLFLDGLKSRGLYENSIIAVYGDHGGLERSDEINVSMERLMGRSYDYDVFMNIPLIISVPGAEKDIRQTVSAAGGQLDFFPTIAYLMGFDELDTLYFGHNLFAVKDGLVAILTYMPKGSFFTGSAAFEMSRDGVFEHSRAWDIRTGKSVPIEECYENYVSSMGIINSSDYILRSDALRRIYIDGEGLKEAMGANVTRSYPDVIACAGAPGEIYGNSIEYIDFSHRNDQRCIRVEMKWDEESEPFAMDDGSGEISMTYGELIGWMENHAETLIVVSIERSGDYFMKFMSEKSPAVADRLILELPELSEYTGKHDAILNVSGMAQSADTIGDFIEKNDVWAIMMTKEDAEGRFSSFLSLDTGVYITGEADGFITKTDREDHHN